MTVERPLRKYMWHSDVEDLAHPMKSVLGCSRPCSNLPVLMRKVQKHIRIVKITCSHE